MIWRKPPKRPNIWQRIKAADYVVQWVGIIAQAVLLALLTSTAALLNRYTELPKQVDENTRKIEQFSSGQSSIRQDLDVIRRSLSRITGWLEGQNGKFTPPPNP